MEKLKNSADTSPESLIRRRKVAADLIRRAQGGEEMDIGSIDPRETSIEVVQQIRGILQANGTLPKIHDQSKIEVNTV